MVRNNLSEVKGYLSIYYVTSTDSMQSMWRIRDTFGDSPNLHKGIVVDVIKRFLSFCLFICGEADRSGRGRCCSSPCCCCCWGIWGDCFQISHVQPKWVHPEKTFLKKWVYPEKTFLQNGCICVSKENFS